MRPRSRHVTAALLGAAAFALAACEEEKVETVVVTDPAACAALGEFSRAECEEGYAEAKAQNDATAPRYDAMEVCEQEHGAGNCQPEVTSSGGSVFMPILMGYMMGRMMGGFGAKPLYPAAGGGAATADGGTRFNGMNGKGAVAPASFQPAPATKNLAPMTKTQVQSRGGFGSSRTMAPGAGSYGG